MTRALATCGAVVFAFACGSSHAPAPDAGPDAATLPDASVDAGGLARDAGSQPDDAGPVYVDAAVYPCDTLSDCTRWWRAGSACVDGICCTGRIEEGECLCGDRMGTCPPRMICCPANERGPEHCSGVCNWGPP